MSTRASRDNLYDEYEVVRLRLTWGAISIATVPLMLSAHLLLRYVPWRPQQLWAWPVVYVLTTLSLAAIGLTAGLLGMRFSRHKLAARFGAVLNGSVLLLVLAAMAGMLYVRYLR